MVVVRGWGPRGGGMHSSEVPDERRDGGALGRGHHVFFGDDPEAGFSRAVHGDPVGVAAMVDHVVPGDLDAVDRAEVDVDLAGEFSGKGRPLLLPFLWTRTAGAVANSRLGPLLILSSVRDCAILTIASTLPSV